MNTLFNNGTHKIESDGVAATPQPETKITRLAFRNRFTFAEKVAIETAAQSDVEVKVLLDDQNSASFVDLARADAAAGLDLLVSKNLITLARRNEILNNPVQPEELTS